jgi:CRP-like cAMP-binding protein
MADGTQAESFLTAEELEYLLPRSHRVAYPSGTTLVREGDHSDFVLHLRSGHIKAETGEPKSIVNVYAPGRIVGELASMTGLPRSADLVALNDVEADLIPGPVWLDFLMANQRANLAMLRHLASRIVAREHPRAESMTSSEHKIAKGLMRLVDADMGQEVENGLRIAGVTQRDLGSICGLSRESAAVVLRRLREAGIVSTGRAHLIIHDVRAIEQLSRRSGPAPLTG